MHAARRYRLRINIILLRPMMYFEQIFERRMLHRVEHVGQREIRQELGFRAELGTPLHEKCAKRLHRTPIVGAVFSAFAVAADFRFPRSFFTLHYGIVHVEVER